MKFRNALRKFAVIRYAAMFILFGLIFASASALFLVKSVSRNTEETTAVIVRLERQDDPSDDTISYQPYVDYEINGTAYHDIPLMSYSSGMHIGDEITVHYDPENPEELYSSGNNFILILFVLVGLGLFAYGIVSIVRFRKAAPPVNEYNQVSPEDIDPAVQKEILNSTEASKTYYFHFQKKGLRQGYDMEDEFKSLVYQANMKKLTFFRPYEFEFVNHRTHISETFSISHVVSTSAGWDFSGSSSFSIPIDCHFKINGVNNWQYIASHGYGIEYHRNKLAYNFDLYHYGVKVASLETMGTAIFDDDKSGAGNFIKRLPSNGLYRVTCRESDLNMVFMCCFSLARAFFLENSAT